MKTWVPYFDAIKDGQKLFEIRKNDRGFMVGDYLRLRKWNQTTGVYTGGEITKLVTYIEHGGIWGLPIDTCIMSVASLMFGRDNAIGHLIDECRQAVYWPGSADAAESELARLLNEREKYRIALQSLQKRIEGTLASDRGPTTAGLVGLKHLVEEALKP